MKKCSLLMFFVLSFPTLCLGGDELFSEEAFQLESINSELPYFQLERLLDSKFRSIRNKATKELSLRVMLNRGIPELLSLPNQFSDEARLRLKFALRKTLDSPDISVLLSDAVTSFESPNLFSDEKNKAIQLQLDRIFFLGPDTYISLFGKSSDPELKAAGKLLELIKNLPLTLEQRTRLKNILEGFGGGALLARYSWKLQLSEAWLVVAQSDFPKEVYINLYSEVAKLTQASPCLAKIVSDFILQIKDSSARAFMMKSLIVHNPESRAVSNGFCVWLVVDEELDKVWDTVQLIVYAYFPQNYRNFRTNFQNVSRSTLHKGRFANKVEDLLYAVENGDTEIFWDLDKILAQNPDYESRVLADLILGRQITR